MECHIDFSLNSRFGVVEQIIFRLVCNGISDVMELRLLLGVFSDAVVANAIRTLVNRQVLMADMAKRALLLSEPVEALVQTCHKNSFEIMLSEEVSESMEEGKLRVKEPLWSKRILEKLLPNVSLDDLDRELDVYICREAEHGE